MTDSRIKKTPADREHTDSAGAVVFRTNPRCCDTNNPNDEVLMIAMGHSRWSFPKGHQEPGETLQQTALREIREETGIGARIVGDFCCSVPSAKAGDQRKVHFFLGVYQEGELKPQTDEVKAALWKPANEAAELISFPADRDMYLQALQAWKDLRA